MTESLGTSQLWMSWVLSELNKELDKVHRSPKQSADLLKAEIHSRRWEQTQQITSRILVPCLCCNLRPKGKCRGGSLLRFTERFSIFLIADPCPWCFGILHARDAVHMYEALSRGVSQKVIWGQVPEPSAHVLAWWVFLLDKLFSLSGHSSYWLNHKKEVPRTLSTRFFLKGHVLGGAWGCPKVELGLVSTYPFLTNLHCLIFLP
jgi:hypothetical protein